MRMKPAAKTLVFYYNEAVIQLGFIAFFATAFPFAPLFSFLTNAFLEACHVVGLGILFFFVLPR